MNDKDKYCGVPDSAAVCADCLYKSEGLFKVFYQQTDVAKWRAAWCSLLLNTDYIRFFSNATLQEYTKAFPVLDNNKCVVVDPHDVDIRFNEKYAVKNNDNVMRLGVFGFIDKHKGSAVVLDLVEAIKARQETIEIHVFGSLNGISTGSDDVLKMHGPYKRENIVKILNENEINIVLMPSICPETFSFVTAELLDTNVDVMTFDLGAQADLTNSKSNGYVVPLFSDVPLIDHVVEVVRNKLNA
ncbi:MAG: hypothetical protein KZQ77_15625, partial [Candidatus Thiodiazotropha sp. (ex Notomyrtea botanica)]|nr:hypothetical protein [Candidatus Thiodiazotropha sp. (ex Notomyrtea botanica)]